MYFINPYLFYPSTQKDGCYKFDRHVCVSVCVSICYFMFFLYLLKTPSGIGVQPGYVELPLQWPASVP